MSEPGYAAVLREYQARICVPQGHDHPTTPDAMIRCGLQRLTAHELTAKRLT